MAFRRLCSRLYRRKTPQLQDDASLEKVWFASCDGQSGLIAPEAYRELESLTQNPVIPDEVKRFVGLYLKHHAPVESSDEVEERPTECVSPLVFEERSITRREAGPEVDGADNLELELEIKDDGAIQPVIDNGLRPEICAQAQEDEADTELEFDEDAKLNPDSMSAVIRYALPAENPAASSKLGPVQNVQRSSSVKMDTTAKRLSQINSLAKLTRASMLNGPPGVHRVTHSRLMQPRLQARINSWLESNYIPSIKDMSQDQIKEIQTHTLPWQASNACAPIAEEAPEISSLKLTQCDMPENTAPKCPATEVAAGKEEEPMEMPVVLPLETPVQDLPVAALEDMCMSYSPGAIFRKSTCSDDTMSLVSNSASSVITASSASSYSVVTTTQTSVGKAAYNVNNSAMSASCRLSLVLTESVVPLAPERRVNSVRLRHAPCMGPATYTRSMPPCARPSVADVCLSKLDIVPQVSAPNCYSGSQVMSGPYPAISSRPRRHSLDEVMELDAIDEV